MTELPLRQAFYAMRAAYRHPSIDIRRVDIPRVAPDNARGAFSQRAFLAALYPPLSAAVFLPFDGGLPSVKKSRELTDNRGSTAHCGSLAPCVAGDSTPQTSNWPVSFLP